MLSEGQAGKWKQGLKQRIGEECCLLTRSLLVSQLLLQPKGGTAHSSG